jgi:hypothetical protein
LVKKVLQSSNFKKDGIQKFEEKLNFQLEYPSCALGLYKFTSRNRRSGWEFRLALAPPQGNSGSAEKIHRRILREIVHSAYISHIIPDSFKHIFPNLLVIVPIVPPPSFAPPDEPQTPVVFPWSQT